MNTILDNLKSHYSAQLGNDISYYLIQPATTQEIQTLEDQIGSELPNNIRDYFIDNETRILIEDGYETLEFSTVLEKSASKISQLERGDFNNLVERVDGEPSTQMKNIWWSKKWIPIAADGGGNLLCIDLDPGSNGILGQIIGLERSSGPYLTEYKSLDELLLHALNFAKEGHIQANSSGMLEEV